MGGVGLFYVGAVLIIDADAAGPHQPTRRNTAELLRRRTAGGDAYGADPAVGGDAAVIFAASGLYLFGFTYLWVAINNVTDWDGEGLGWFSLFVAIAALGYSWHAFTAEADPAFGVIWLLWAVLWFMLFLLLGLGHDALGPAVGFVAVAEGVITAAVPAFLIVSGNWETGPLPAAVIAVIGFAAVVLAYPIGRRLAAPSVTNPPPAALAATTR